MKMSFHMFIEHLNAKHFIYSLTSSYTTVQNVDVLIQMFMHRRNLY